MLRRTLFCFLILFLSASALTAQDNDGDLVPDVTDLDDDNDGILDQYDCQIPVTNYSFESPAGPPYYVGVTDWTITGGNGSGTHDVQPANNYPAADDGNQFFFINTNNGVLGEATSSLPFGVYGEGGYILTVAVGDGIDAGNSFRNDAVSTIELGYGDDAASFIQIASRTIDGATETPAGLWTDFQLAIDLTVGDPAIGQGILIRITHTGAAGANAGNYDNVRLEIDSDGDGISNCFELDSDGDGINDVLEAGYTDADNNGYVDPYTFGNTLTVDVNGVVIGSVNTGNTDDVFDNTKDGSLILDNDGDTYIDKDDLDDDNDGILDTNECDVPITNYSFETGTPPGDPITGWTFTDLGSTGWGVESPTLGTTYYQIPKGNSHAFINGSGIITLNEAGAAFAPGDYIISFEVGDALDFSDPFANDGETVFEIGYDNGTFQTLGTETVEAWQTPNGVWTDFSFTINVPVGSPALGEGILVRITHTANSILNQERGDYDQIRVLHDRDSNGVADCLEDDIDGDGCPDVTEAGHTDGGSGIIANSGVNSDGTVNPIGSGYTGTTQAVISNTINICTQDFDFDNDGIDDVVDLDDDNDGIRDVYECEIPLANNSFETATPPTAPIDSWQTTNGAQVYGIEAVNGTNFTTTPEGTSFGFINGDGFIVLNEIWGTYDREGTYILEFYIGDPIPFSANFSNDSRTTVELGYSDGTTFNVIPGAALTVESYDTPNGVWSVFTVIGAITNADAAFGQGVSVRITHEDTTASNISQTTFDNFSLKLDTDGDGQPNCTDLDSDNPGGISCADVLEAGHTDAGGGLLGSTVDANGLVTGAPTGYTGPRWQMWDSSTDLACNPIDTDGDGVVDGDYFRYDAGNNIQTNIDLDNDNDGISDEEEDCDMLNTGLLRQTFNFEIPVNSDILGGSAPFSDIIDFWTDESGTGNAFAHLVNAETYPPGNNAPNYKVDGTLLPDLPDPDYQNDAYLALNGDVTITQTESRLILEEGVYMLTIAIGDAIDMQDSFRNDGTSTIEVGYDTNPLLFLVNFNTLGATLTINPEDTPNGTWTDFSLNFEVPAGSPAIGNTLSVRISHDDNPALNQESGNYDHIRIQRNSDGILTGDLIPDCMDLDSDEDGCLDTIEAGNVDDDMDGVLGTGTPTVDGQGLVQGLGGYPSPVSPDVRNFSEPAVIVPPFDDQTTCENGNVTFTVTATRAGSNPTIEYEWAESTDGGTTWNILSDIAPYSGTSTDNLTITGATAGQDSNQYRVRVRGDDHECYNEDFAVLNVNAGPVQPTLTPVNANICAGNDAEFSISGDPDDIITYSFDGGTTTATVTLDGTGNGIITQSAATTDVTVDITDIEDDVTGCSAPPSTPINTTVIVTALPTITIDLVQCDPSLTTYFVDFTISAGTVTADFGTVVGNRVENIPAGTAVTITVDDAGCTTSLTQTPPDCSCPVLDAPTNPVDAAICEGTATPALSVDIPATGGDAINWYDAPTGGTLVGTGTNFTPADTAAGTYTYYAETLDTASACTSNTRTAVTLDIIAVPVADVLPNENVCDSFTLPALSAGNNYYTATAGGGTLLNAGDVLTATQTVFIFAESATTPNCTDESSFDVTITPSPTLTADLVQCDPSLTTYFVDFTISAGTVTADAGTVVGNSVTGIPAGTDVNITVVDGPCSITVLVTAPNCNCPVLDAPNNPVDAAICGGTATPALSVDIPATGGDAINWYDAPTGGTLVGTGTNFTPADTAAGTYTYYAETLDTASACTSNTRTAVTLDIIAVPVADVLPNENVCDSFTLPALSAGNNYYTATAGGGTLLNAGDVPTATQTVFIFAESATTPNCTDESSFDVTITPSPTLTADLVQCDPSLTTYFVDFTISAGTVTADAGTVVGNSVTGIPAGTDVNITVVDGPCSITVLVTAPNCNCPVLDAPTNPVDAAICEGTATPALSVDIPATGGDAINWYDAPTGGTLVGTGTNFTPADTAAGTYTYYAETLDTASACTSNTRTAVTLDIIAVPVADVLPNENVCDSFTLPALSAGNNYYTATAGGGTLLNAGDVLTATQTVFIFAESATTPNCTDESSFDVTITPSPTLTADLVQCDPSLTTYFVDFTISAGTVTADAGTVVGNSVTGIPAGTDVNITVVDGPCSITVLVTAPNCNCPVLDAPNNPVDAAICGGTATPALSVDIPATGGDAINWYDAPTGGTLVGTGTNFTPADTAAGTYTYYAETVDSVSLCTSASRTPVTLTIDQIPSADNFADQEACESFTLQVLSPNNRYFTGSGATGQELFAGTSIVNSQIIFVFAENPENTACSDETNFEITILNEPIIMLPEAVSLCNDGLGSGDSVELGMDLGPQYRYDWTPNNDTDGDGIEEPIFNVIQAGTYSLEIYQIGTSIECGGTVTYTTEVTESLRPLSIDVEVTAEGFELNTGNMALATINNDNLLYDQFEYSLDNPDGPFQAENYFTNIPGGLHRIYVRGFGDCGETLASDPFLIVNYPTVFTPNGDGTNETWNILGTDNPNITGDVTIQIFDRHGKLMAQIDPLGIGWDGTYNTRPVPSADYWFIVNYTNLLNNERSSFNGHFSLIR